MRKDINNIFEIFEACKEILMFLMLIIWILCGVAFFDYFRYTKICSKLEDIKCRVENIENK
jgi:hypothetical protein